MSKDPGAVLIVDDDPDILTAGKLLLRRHYQRVDTTADPRELPALLGAEDYLAILLDMNFGPGEASGEQGLNWLRQIMALDADAAVVVITAHGDVGLAVEAMKVGAADFVSKPWENERLLATLAAAARLRRSRAEAHRLQQTNTALQADASAAQPMLGEGPAMAQLRDTIARAAPTEANVLILGENGTGKELVARELHRQSLRADEVFVSVDMGAISATLFESELFGHKKGAFTDARTDRVGRFEAASGGTLFLDEIGNIPLNLQAKLLTVLEQRQVTPVGGNRPVAIDVRVLAATNLSAEQLADESRFRQDLLFRLNTVAVNLPPLRQRPEDIPAIALYYAGFYGNKYNGAPRQLNEAALAAIVAYSWPGNVRALRHAVERAVILSPGGDLQAEDFQLPASVQNTAADAPGGDGEDLNLERLQRAAVEQALRRNGYNISHAAKALGLTRAALYRRMEKYGL